MYQAAWFSRDTASTCTRSWKFERKLWTPVFEQTETKRWLSWSWGVTIWTTRASSMHTLGAQSVHELASSTSRTCSAMTLGILTCEWNCHLMNAGFQIWCNFLEAPWYGYIEQYHVHAMNVRFTWNPALGCNHDSSFQLHVSEKALH